MSLASMTGYGEGRDASPHFRFAVRLRSVNHRSLDLHVRVPEICRGSEDAVRRKLTTALHRGRVELTLDLESLGSHGQRLRVDETLAADLARIVAEWRERGLIAGQAGAADFLRIPGLLTVEGEPESWTDQDEHALLGAVDAALEGLLASRRREGASIAAALEERLATLRRVVGELQSRRDEMSERLHAELRRRLEELLAETPVDEDRLLMEAAILAERGEIAEELDRLRAHLDHFEQLAGGVPPHGKRLDFLAQEIARELNTAGAKCREAAMTRLVVEARSACEQLREQLQNVE